MQDKIRWSIVLLADVVLFIFALLSGKIALNVGVIALSIIIYKYGNPVLFKEIDNKKRKQLAESKAIREAVEKVIQDKKLFSKK